MEFEAKEICKSFGGVQALKGADFFVSGPKICGLVGSNGSGKSTFAKICSGLLRKDRGTITIDGKEVHFQSPEEARAQGIALAHQNLSLIPELTVWQNISLTRESKRKGIFLDNKRARFLAQDILDTIIPGEISIETKVAYLSPEHKQMVEIAKVLIKKPQLLILDEPTAALQYYHVKALFTRVRDLKEMGVSIIFVSHRLHEITELCDIVIAFRDGETVGTIDFENEPRDENLIVPLVAGEDCDFLGCVDKGRQHPGNEICVELKNISAGPVLKNINMTCRKGEILGIGGLHGQGQDELINLLAGDVLPDSGEIFVNSQAVKIHHPHDAIRVGLCLVPGDRLLEGLYTRCDVFFNSVIPLLAMKKEPFVINKKRLSKKVDEILERTVLKPKRSDMIVNNLSGGNQQKVVFGMWLHMEPKVLLLNDPMKGIDIHAKNTLYSIIHQFADKGTAIILFASSNEELIAHCDRVLVMFEGGIVEELEGVGINEDRLIKSSLRVEAVK